MYSRSLKYYGSILIDRLYGSSDGKGATNEVLHQKMANEVD